MFLKKHHLALFSMLCIPAGFATPSPAQLQLSKALGWVVEPNQYNLCGGYYKELPIPYVANPNVNSQDNNYNIYANHADYSFVDNSVFTGNVKVIRPTQEMTSDIAHLIRNPKTKQITQITATGDVHYLSQGMLLIGDDASLETGTNKLTIDHLTYRHSFTPNSVAVQNPKTGQTEYHLYQLTARGDANFGEQVRPHIYSFKDASYTTCPPTSNVWKVTGTRVHLNYYTGWGYIVNGFLKIHSVPIMYLPYYSFPIDKRRHTGFLAPTYGSSNTSGNEFILPFYWNMAPNYDMLITPDWMSKRGIKTNLLSRYLTSNSHGALGLSFLPHDSEFHKFQHQAPSTYGGQSKYADQLRDLEDYSDNRKAIAWDNATTFNDHWNDSVTANYASDDYYTQDFGSHFFLNNNGDSNHLLENANINYRSTYWRWSGLVNGYQTFHPINESGIDNQYAKLPQLNLSARSPAFWDGFRSNFSSQYTYFDIAANPDQQHRPVSGSRVFAEPSVGYSFTRPYGFLMPTLRLHSMAYQLLDNLNNTPKQEGRAIPIFSTHGKLIFVREIHPFHYALKQTLEPEFYYLYTPFFPQNAIPNFDTDQSAFTYDSLFSYNRFSGIDRVGDANQVSLGVTSRFINSDTGDQKAMAGIGEMYYFRERKVSACYGRSNKCKNAATGDAVNKDKLSPIAAEFSYNFNPTWSVIGNWAWSPEVKKTANQYITFQYDRDNNHIINFSYNDINNKVSGIGITQDHITLDSSVPPYQELRQASVSTSWEVIRRIQLFGSLDHDWSTNQGSANQLAYNTYNSFMYGLEYNSCCWAVRLLGYREFNGLNDKNRATFQHGIFLQFALLGLGTLGHSVGGTGGDSGMLGSIGNYQDNFGQG